MIYVDIETRSRVNLKTLGVYKYVECPDFRILMAAWSRDDGKVQIAIGHDEILDIPGLLDPTVDKVAHNAQFERVCLGVLVDSLQDPAQWIDTSAIAAEYGYPVSLDGVSKALGVTEKDSAGTKLVKLFTQPNRDGSWNDETTHPMEWLDFIAYCEQDVGTMVEVHQKLGDFPTPMERQVWIADQRINDRGMRIDRELCTIAAQMVDSNKLADKEEFRALTGVDNPGSVQQVMRWCEEVGMPLPNLQAETIQEAIDDPLTDPAHVRVLELRQDLALAAGGKFSAALDVVSPDDRIRGGFRFFGAHTGRWSGQRVQPQNLPRATVPNPEAAILDLKMGLGADSHTLKALVRSMFIGPISVVDYASIEARVVAWMANEEWALEAFREGRDIYVETACLAEGTLVLTHLGLVPIQYVESGMLLWDGVEWVDSGGATFSGEKDVYEYHGLRATEEHLVWVEGAAEAVPFGEAIRSGRRLARSGSWTSADNPRGEDDQPTSRSRMRPVRVSFRTLGVQPSQEGETMVRKLPRRVETSGFSIPGSSPGLLVRSQRLRRKGSRIQVPKRFRSSSLDVVGERDLSRDGHREDRQRRPLRSGERPLGDSVTEHAERSLYSSSGWLGTRGMAIRRGFCSTDAGRGDEPRTDLRTRSSSGGPERSLVAHYRGKARVYDIVNCGPRNRFTAEGFLVHNSRMSTPSNQLTRFQGKVAVLALGYNGGVNSLRAMGAEGDDDTLRRLVMVWRRANPRIVRLWETMQEAVESGGKVGPHIKITRRGGDMKMHLPSGRAIHYHGVKWERYVEIHGGGKKVVKEGWRYNDPKRGGARIGTYGGRLTENATQAIARDILAEALVRLEEAGYPVVGHVHDEVIVESTELEHISKLMTQVPRWARGLPIDGEGYLADRYRK